MNLLAANIFVSPPWQARVLDFGLAELAPVPVGLALAYAGGPQGGLLEDSIVIFYQKNDNGSCDRWTTPSHGGETALQLSATHLGSEKPARGGFEEKKILKF